MSDDEGTEVEAFMSVRGGPYGKVHQPIHESITLAALIHGNFGIARGTTLDNVSVQDWEYVRGAVWNDDPACLLFKDSSDDNKTYSYALEWAKDYTLGEYQWKNGDKDRLQNVTGRSHYGDLQFLHAMASNIGESPQETKRKLMTWLEVIYKLARGEDGISKDTEIQDTKFNEFCPPFAFPQRWKTLGFWFARNSAFQKPDIQRRAIGSIFHIIQDSYAIGHTRRTILNPQDKLSDHPLKFKPGTYDQWGAIENFHTYAGQGSDHSHYDHSDDQPPTNLDDVEAFNSLLGCRMAVDKCEAFMSLFQAGKKWDEGVRQFFEDDVFKLSENASGANNEVW